MFKICTKCTIAKESSAYFKCNKAKSGLQSQCKICKLVSVKNAPSSSLLQKRLKAKTEKYRATRRDYHHKTKLARNISRRIRQSLKLIRKSTTWQNLVDYTLEDLKSHLQSQFKGEMCWENYGKIWHIDHIKPISLFSIVSETCEDFKACWRLTNLQPLFVIDNLRKSTKLNGSIA